jgi:hypothetical protein
VTWDVKLDDNHSKQEDDMSWMSILADVIGIASAVFAIAAWINTLRIKNLQKHEIERLNQMIRLRLVNLAGKKATIIDLKGEMRREEMSRSEILGWIGMLPMIKAKERERYKIAYTSTEEFFTRMNQIQAGHGDMLFEIPCTEEELNQFDVEKKVVLIT